MALVPWNASIVDDNGEPIPSAAISVTRVSGGTPTLYSDAAGTAKANPFNTGTDGFAQFWTTPGKYTVAATGGGSSVTWTIDLVDVEANIEFSDRASATDSDNGQTGAATQIIVDGLRYEYDASGTALTTGDGRTWKPVYPLLPEHWGAVGDGLTDDQAAIQLWLNYAVNDAAHNQLIGPKANLQLDGGKQYAIGSTLNIPSGSDGLILSGLSLIAVGTWNANDYMVVNNATYSDFQSISLNCAKKCNGWEDAAGSGRCRHWSLQIYKMSNVGYHKSAGGGEMRMFGAQITEYLSGDAQFADQNNFVATGIFIEQSDCKIHDSNVRWCGTAYASNAGIQNVYNSHFVQGTSGAYGRTNAKLIDWNPGAGTGFGELNLYNCYLDNGYCEFYDDKVNLVDCTVLHDEADADIDNFFTFYANGQAECRATASIRFHEWAGTANLFEWVDYGGHTWSSSYASIRDNMQSSISSSSNHQKVVARLFDVEHLVSTNNNSAAQIISSAHTKSMIGFEDADTTETKPKFGSKGNNAYVSSDQYFEVDAKGIGFKAYSDRPGSAPEGAIALSDGTLSTNGFGESGKGLYEVRDSRWVRLGGPLSGENSNGSWTKFVDGTMICRKSDFQTSYFSADECLATWTFPQAFSADPVVVSNPRQPVNAAPNKYELAANVVAFITPTSAQIRQGRVSGLTDFQSGNYTNHDVIAIGRWM